jgi:hypothetical protein
VVDSGVQPLPLAEPPAHSSLRVIRLDCLICVLLGLPAHISSPSSPKQLDRDVIDPGFRESEEDDSTLSVVLDSLIPFIRDTNATVKLPVYLGKVVHVSNSGEGDGTSHTHTEGAGKEFSWSRGLGIEHSPIKT